MLILPAAVLGIVLVSLAARADIIKVVVDGTINPITAEYISRGIDHATQSHAQAVIIELRTPGGLVDSTREIISKILSSSVPVIVYVAPSGSRAGSAGFYILESADIAAMAPGTNAGSAHPVLGSGATMDPVMKEKLENDSAAFMRSFVSKRGRNVDVAESAVRQSKSFTEQEALQQKLIDLVAPSQEELLKQLDGRQVKRFDGNTFTLHTNGASVVTYPMTLKEHILGFLMDPNIAFLILIIGALAIYAEFNTPGAVIPGVVGLIFVVLALFALNLLPIRFAAVGLLLVSFMLFGLEAKFNAHGALGVGGIVMMILGALLLVDGPIPEMRIHLLTALAVSIPFGAITIFLVSIAVRARRNKIVTGISGLIGETAIAQTALTPTGKVFLNGELWDAKSPTSAPAGTTVVVKSVNGLQLTVEPVASSASTPASLA
jgi:membrane-bound serine protease (ClpP class)